MNSKFIVSTLIAAASLVSVNAFAAGADGSVEVQPTLISNLTRAQVQAEALAAPRPGPVTASHMVDGGTMQAPVPVTSNLSRAAVRAEAAAHVRDSVQKLERTSGA